MTVTELLTFFIVCLVLLALLALSVRFIVLAIQGEKFYSIDSLKAVCTLSAFFAIYVFVMVSDA